MAEHLRSPRSREALTAEQERALVLAARADDEPSRSAFVQQYVPLIARVARSFRGTPAVDHDDLMQEGVVGLMRALHRFDPDLGTPFWGYAWWWVRRGMQQLVAELGRPVVLSDQAALELARIRAAQRHHAQTRGCQPTVGELTSATGIDRLDVERLLAAAQPPQALDRPPDGERRARWGDLVADPRSEEAIEQVYGRVAAEDIELLLAGLSGRERAVVRARYGIGTPASTLRQVGARIGVTPEGVRRIERRALDKLRESADPGDTHAPDA